MPRKNNKSGYTSLPVRIQLKSLDDQKNKQSSVIRTGDRDRKGDYNINFDDSLTHIFAKRIKDNFENSGFDNTTSFDLNKWLVSDGQLIKREIINTGGTEKIDKCFVFAGRGDSEGRWIRTAEKIRNPTITFNLIIGPHNNIKGGLNLKKSTENSQLLVQMSQNLSTWTTVKTITTKSLPSFYEVEDNNFPKNPRKKIILSEFDFNATRSFYVRIIQELSSYTFTPGGTTFYNASKSIFAISNIDIVSNNQNVIYPTVNNDTHAGLQVINSTIANSNSTSSINAVGRIQKGVSDTGFVDRNFDENLTAFNEVKSISAADMSFLEISGVDANIYSGFSQKLFNKTRIDIDLSPSTSTEFGYIKPYLNNTISKTSPDGQQLMVYWNNVLKKWEKIGQPLTLNGTPSGANVNVLNNAASNLKKVLTSSALGFSPVGIIATGSAINVRTGSVFFPEEVISSYVRPVSAANFPFGGQYHASSSQIIRAKDIGINQPFLLEGTSLRFDAELEIAGEDATSVADQYSIPIAYPKTGEPGFFGFDRSVKAIIPSFFILRQFNDNFNHNADFTMNFRSSASSLHTHQAPIPGNYHLVSGSSIATYVKDSRELITYKQITYIVSSSLNISDTSPVLAMKNPMSLLDAGLGRETNVIIEGSSYRHSDSFSLTGSYVINSKIKIPGKINSFIPYKISGSHPTDDEILLGHEYGGRQRGNLDSTARALYNGNVTRKASVDFRYPLPSVTFPPFKYLAPQKEDIDKISPYIIFPEDKLILGWQYPLNAYSTTNLYLENSLSRNSMRLLGGAKLELYGSLIRSGKELHDTCNQNLTSNNIHEDIHSKLLDTYQIAQRGELSGSYIDDRLVSLAYTGATADITKSGNNITKNPVNRVGTHIVSAVNLKNSLLSHNVPAGGLTPTSISSTVSSKMEGVNRFVRLNSENLFYKDDNQPVSYYLDYKQTGNLINLISSTKDSHIIFKQSKLSQKSELSLIGASINVVFVKEDDIDNTTQLSKIRSFVSQTASEQVEFESFQSSNISTSCTSSLPFFDDNTPRNRTYSTGDFIAV